MDRSRRVPNNRKRRPPTKNQTEELAAAAAAAKPENFVYDNQDFPSLSAAPVISTKKDSKSSTQLNVQPKIDDHDEIKTQPLESSKTEASVTTKRASPWKTPAEPMQAVPLMHIISECEEEKATSKKNLPTAYTSVIQPETRFMTRREDEIDTKLCEIILNIHLRKEYVSLERVEQELFAYYRVQSFRDLHVHQQNLKTLTNLIHRIKDVTFYMQIFEQVFNLCTLHDLGPLIARFLKLETYEDAHLGPLDENPAVQRVFKYKPRKRHQPIPELTCGQIINSFLVFGERYHRNERYDYDAFLDDLVQQNQLHNQKELGIYIKSFSYLIEVSRKVDQECNKYKKQIEKDAQRQIIRTIETRLGEIQNDVEDELNSSAYINKSPIAVLDYLVSIVDKYLTVPQQKLVRDILMKIRESELLRCLLNISIYLGTIDEPAKFIDEIQKFNRQQVDESGRQNSTSTKSMNHSKKDHQHTVNMQNSNTTIDLSRPTIETSFENSSSRSSFENRPKISIKQLCSDMFKILVRFDTVLTLKQLFDLKKYLCNQYSLHDFSEFGIANGDDKPLDIITFLHTYRQEIDPNGELLIYETNASSTGDRHELYSFVNQLAVINTWREKQQGGEFSTSREVPLTKNQLSAIGKALQYKFGETLTNTRSSQIIKKAKNQFHKEPHSIIHFEESLLDEVNLNRLGICPPSLLVDESQLCKIMLQCPIMDDLSTWLQWSDFFQSRYGSLKAFIARKKEELDCLLLLETSNHELLRLPIDSSLDKFVEELEKRNIRSSVGHLCSIIMCEYVQVNQLPKTIYQQVMKTWFIDLRSSAQLERDRKEPMQYIMEFMTYLPGLIGQSRIVQELILDPLDEVFGENEEMNARERIWLLAHGKQKSKLEKFGYILDIDEWKNENKWKGIEELEEEVNIQSIQTSISRTQILLQDTDVPIRIQSTSVVTIPTSPAVIERPNSISIITNIDDANSGSAAFEHIKQIREGFGVNNNLDSVGQSIVDNLKGVLERSLEKLSNDLYSDQGHFVLELIQNADDNHYPSDCLPTLRFIVSSNRILVCNNEIGFQSNNVTAICNVGKSTKGKHKQGYTGHKGIGFKSVFMVSHRPEIHSGDYHFCFDTLLGNEQIGYIRPIWLEQSEEILPSAADWKTCIRLPIKIDQRGDRLKRNFDDIQARLLLFLNRLRQIEIVREKDNHENHTRSFTRIDHAQGQIIELQERTTTSDTIVRSFWLVVKSNNEVPPNIKMYLNDIKGDVQSTIIAIAYPLDAIHEASSYAILPSQPLFAYLPLRSYGFRFILQGDFEIPATRQEVLRDNIWNDWLKKEMAQLIPVAYDLFKNLPNLLTTCSVDVQKHIGSLNSLETLKYFIKMIPARNEIDPYFNSFIDKSIKGLMGCIRLPIINEDTQEILQWISPTQCVFVRDSFIKHIFTSDLLLSHFNSYYLNEQFVHECDETILMKLGCRRLDFSTILKLIKTLYTQNDQEHSTKTTSIEQIAQWFLCIDYSLQQEREKPSFNLDDTEHNELTTIDQLKKLKIIPLQEQTRLVSIEEMKERVILFPLDKSTQFSKYLKLAAEGLPTIDQRLIEYIEKKYPRRLDSIKNLLKSIGISEFNNVRRIFTNHILPIMSDEMEWKTKSDSVLIAYLILIYKDLYSLNPAHFANDMEKLRNYLIIKTRQVEQLVNTQWSSEIGTLSSLIFEPFLIQDSCCAELDAFITSKDSLTADQYLEILQYLDFTFQYFRSYYSASVIRSRDRHTGDISPVHGVASSLCLSLRGHSWIPVSNEQFYKPSDVYWLPMNHPFRRYVPCLDPLKVLLKDKNFIEVLGFQSEILPMTMFELLMKWSCNLDHDKLWKLINTSKEQNWNIIPCTISTESRQLCHDTVLNIQNIYIFICQDENIRRLLASFRHWPLIFIPRTNNIGEFLYANEVFWQDPLGLLTPIGDTIDNSKQPIAIQPYYQNNHVFQQFFFNTFQIKQGPTLNDYLLLLKNIKYKTLDHIWKCICVITKLAFTDNKQSFVRDTTIDWPFIPCLNNGNKCVKYTDRPYFPHDMTIANLFSDVIRIIQLPNELIHMVEFKQQFCTLFNIEDLANVIKLSANVDNEQIASELQEFYSYSIEIIQYCLIHNKLLSEERASYLQSIFSEMNFLSVGCIDLSYQYGENIFRKTPSPSTLICYIEESTRKFFILQKYETNENYHIDAMVNYLIQDTSIRLKLSESIQKLYKSYKKYGIESLMKERDGLPGHNLPKWVIPRTIKKELDSSVMKKETEEEEEEDEANNDEIIITPEMLEKMKNEPGWQLKKPSTKILVDPTQPKRVTCFPATAGAVRTDEILDNNHPSISNLQLTDMVKKQKTTINDEITSSSSNPTDHNFSEHTAKQLETEDREKDVKTMDRSTVPHTTSARLGDFTSIPPPISFEHIRISNFTDIVLSPTILPDQSAAATMQTSNNEIDIIVGRRGEDFVYRYLQWKHSDAQIQWINQQAETGQPFDIEIIHKDKNKKPEFIEVKTTRVPNQNTFQISIGEVDCLLQYQNNYYIYRVYYNDDDEKLSTITILSRIKYHLQQKKLALSITIAEKFDE
ncbi:hypothetical protein I4U23_003704 [Adineta vaga]|nr:hypothetical protein I4U23_003704 [Adineta vaga]